MSPSHPLQSNYPLLYLSYIIIAFKTLKSMSAPNVAEKLPAGTYTVIAVDSADRFTVALPPKDGVPQAKGVIISDIVVPRIGRGAQPDDPCAYEAREVLRQAIIGKSVRIDPDYEIEPLQRTSARVTLSTGEDVAAMIVKAGYALVNERQQFKTDANRLESLKKYVADAKLYKRGMNAADSLKKIRPVLPFPPANIAALAASLNGKEEKVHVDRVHSPTSLFVTILATHQPILLHFTGVQPCRDDPKIITESKSYVERLLVHRHVNVRFEGTDSLLNMLGSIVSPKGVFQTELLSRGYAKIGANTIVNVTDVAVRETLREAEKAAQGKKAGIWKNYVDPAAVASPASELEDGAPSSSAAAGVTVVNAPQGPRNDFKGAQDFEGTLVQVVSGDLVVVRPTGSIEQIRLSLSGVRANKAVREQSGNQPETRVTYSDYAWEARELLRSKYIGALVNVHIDYTRTIEETKEIRAAATVIDAQSGVNIGAAVIEEGYAKYFLGKSDVSAGSAVLQDAEASAKARGVGIHSGKTAPQTKVTELGRLGDAKAKYYLPFLQRGMSGNKAPLLKGVVDVVMGAGSFRVHIPKEHFQIALKLGGIIVPSSGFDGAKDDAFAKESKEFAVGRLQQREVEIQVDTSDRGGNFIGNLFINGKNFALALLEEGYAAINVGGRSGPSQAFTDAEASARAAKKNIWSSDAAAPGRLQKLGEELKASGALVRASGASAQWRSATIANVLDGNTIVLHYPEESEVLSRISEAVTSLGSEPHFPSAKKGDLVAALFREDNSWYRARVAKVSAETAEVTFIDFGNRQAVKIKDLRKLPNDSTFDPVRSQAPLAHIVKLFGIRDMDESQNYCDAACDLIWAFAEKGTLQTRVEYTANDNTYVSVAPSTKASDESLSEVLLKEGLALVDKRAPEVLEPAVLTRLKAAQEHAHRKHANLWKFGDAGADDEEDY